MLDTLTAEMFTPAIGDTFHLLMEGLPPIEMELVSVVDRSAFTSGKIIHDQGKRMPFTLTFRNSENLYLPQRIYHFEQASEQPQLSPMDIFIVPIGPDSKGMLYEAVFS